MARRDTFLSLFLSLSADALVSLAAAVWDGVTSALAALQKSPPRKAVESQRQLPPLKTASLCVFVLTTRRDFARFLLH